MEKDKDKGEALYYQLEDYLDGKLTEEQRRDLQARIAAEEEVAEQLALVRLERELARLMDEDEMDAKIKQWAGKREEENGAPPAGRGGVNRWLWGGVIFVCLLAVGYWLFVYEPPPGGQGQEQIGVDQHNEPSSPEEKQGGETTTSGQERQLTDTVPGTAPPPTDPQKNPPVAEKPTRQEKGKAEQLALALAKTTSPIGHTGARSAGRRSADEEESPLDKGFRLMGENNLEEARKTLEAIPPEPRGIYLNARQYLAYVYFEQGDYQAAIPVFEDLIRIPYADAGKMKWYLALAYLSTGDTGKGLPLAREVAANGNEKEAQEAAVKLLRDLGEK